ncbi:hypothetical protein [Streptomyces sp. NPDC059003]|uniref:hypothetical protein n=1 Tax=Streptomyces sp. NPDC059003 TaxID=3346691 RepID=UPI0036A84A72
MHGIGEGVAALALALAHDLRSVRPAPNTEDLDAFKQDLVAGFVLARSAAGVDENSVRAESRVISECRNAVGRHRVPEAAAPTEVHVTREFVQCPIDEMNRPGSGWGLNLRIPLSDAEVTRLFDGWKGYLLSVRKFLPEARNYTAGRRWSRIGETTGLDLPDLLWDVGPSVRPMCGSVKGGSHRRGLKQRMAPLINGSRGQLVWYAEDVRGQFNGAWDWPGGPQYVSVRHSKDSTCNRAKTEGLHTGLVRAVERHLSAARHPRKPEALRRHSPGQM